MDIASISIIVLSICSVAALIIGKIAEKSSIIGIGFLGLSVSVGLVISTL